MENEKRNNSRKLYLPIYLMMLILIVVIGFIKFYDLPLNNLVFSGAITFIILGICLTEIHRLINSYEITPNYLIHRHGIISRKTKKILIESIVDVDLKQNVPQRLLNYGSLDIHSASGANLIKVGDISNPAEFGDILESRMGGGMAGIRKRRGKSFHNLET